MACKQLTMASSEARNLPRPNNLSGDLTDGCVNNFSPFASDVQLLPGVGIKNVFEHV